MGKTAIQSLLIKAQKILKIILLSTMFSFISFMALGLISRKIISADQEYRKIGEYDVYLISDKYTVTNNTGSGNYQNVWVLDRENYNLATLSRRDDLGVIGELNNKNLLNNFPRSVLERRQDTYLLVGDADLDGSIEVTIVDTKYLYSNGHSSSIQINKNGEITVEDSALIQYVNLFISITSDIYLLTLCLVIVLLVLPVVLAACFYRYFCMKP
ncbi:hypothetical protein [Acaryochloris sp. IP29b_bin.137]|uniref:hypothetical protein n=1 Tax=Acaryochloris sp. IP29b_bin.137 TaxID=2969217 RepID=UPI002636321D|nr:hypothetical protein [Acaryochloris sp. IP29b_bin.137]